MNWLKRHKLNAIGLTIVTLLFLISVVIRQPNYSTPLQANEWITAHTLITAEIWDQNGGPSAYDFNPIYNYPGEGNAYRSALGGIVAENGEVFYVSYPPFTFIFYYYASQIFGGPSISSIRIISLFIHFLTSLLIFFLLQKIRSKKNQHLFNYGGLIAAGFYLFAKGNLWFHGNLYFADTLVQPLFIGGILLSLHYYKGEFKRENLTLIALFFVFFFATYTEWIGLLSAFITGLFFLIKAIGQRNKSYLKPFFVIGIASSLAIALPIVQYTSIDGWESLKTTTSTKYAERSGYDDQANSAKLFNIHKSDTLKFLIGNFDANYKYVEYYFGYTAGLFLLLYLIRKRIKKPEDKIRQTNNPTLFVLTILTLPVLLHYLLLFNFNAMHQFAALKTASFLVIVIGLMIAKIQVISKEIHPYLQIGSLLFLCLFFIFKANQSKDSYLEDFNPEKKIDFESIATAKIMQVESKPNTATFATMSLNPNLIYYAKHIYAPLTEFDAEQIFQIMEMRRNEYGDFYQHEEDGLHAIIRFRKLDDRIEIIDTLNY